MVMAERPNEDSTSAEVAHYLEEGFWESFSEGIESGEEEDTEE